MNTPHTLEGLRKLVLLYFQNGEVGEDNDGQLVIYTGLKENDQNTLEEIDE